MYPPAKEDHTALFRFMLAHTILRDFTQTLHFERV